MKKFVKILCIVLTVAILLTAAYLIFFRKEKREIIWVNYGESKNIPCLQIPNAEFATTDEFRYILRKANKPGVSDDWGVLEQKIRQEDAPIEGRFYGNGVYLTRYANMTLEIYNDFVEDMESQGFQILARSDLAQQVYTTSLRYQGNSYTVTYFAQQKTIDVTASKEDHLSPNLQKENSSTNHGAVEGISTTMTTWAHRDKGVSYVIQLPNGHFVISGGGTLYDLPKLIAYLEENAPEGEKPVVDAWFISSGNYDIMNWVTGFTGTPGELKYLPDLIENPAKDRIYINGLYYNAPGADVIDATAFVEHQQDGETYYSKASNVNPGRVVEAVESMQTENGEQTPLYRPMSGQVYYFNGGLTVEIPLTQEQMDMADYEMEFKVSSSCLLFRCQGKTFLDMGYICQKNQEKLMNIYGEDYFSDLDILGVSYRGGRMYEKYQDAFCGDLVIYPNTKIHQLTEESAAVYHHYAEKEGVQLYSYADGILRYDFATGKVDIEPQEQKPPRE